VLRFRRLSDRAPERYPDSAKQWLREALGLPEGDTPFPWQEELLTCFTNGVIDRSLDIPTGLGKTAVMAIWLVARALSAALPRRLVYVVDRRAVVDQATDVAKSLREWIDRDPEIKQMLGLRDGSLPISTLRGQYIDNKEWLEDPASPSIIVGTIDMIGSRLLFEGYGTSRKMRPYHAGLLGADTLVVLDEAHLVPPFEKLLETVADGAALFGPRDEALQMLVPSFKHLALSATGRTRTDKPFGLTEEDLTHPVVRRRLDAPKRLTNVPLDHQKKVADALAEQAWKLSGNGTRAMRIIVFCDKRKDAEDAKKAIEQIAKGDKKAGVAAIEVDIELFVGGRRVFERDAAALRLKKLGFIAGTKVAPIRTTFLFATSAGEVGVDLDADDMVCDLVAWERMVQRLGRVNRRGDGDASVIVVVEPEPKPKKAVQEALAKDASDRTEKESKAVWAYEASIRKARALAKPLDRLQLKNGAADASTGALRELKLRAETDVELRGILDAATTPAPLRPALSRALVDAWSMTSLKEHTGRPEIDPWLRGWIENDRPQTSVVWRTHMPVRTHGGAATRKEIEEFFEAAPPHASEILETETYRVVGWLTARAKALAAGSSGGQPSTPLQDGEKGERPLIRSDDVVAVALTTAGDLRKTLRLKDLALGDDDKQTNKTRTQDLERFLAGATLIVDARIRGLRDGLLDDASEDVPRSVDDGKTWISNGVLDSGGAVLSPAAPVVRFRVRLAEAGHPPTVDAQWRERLRFATDRSEDGEPTRWLIVEKWRHDAATEEDRSAGRPQLLDEHQSWTEERARDLARRLHLPDMYVDMLAIAARLHDEGKQAKRWQRAFNAKPDGVYAKTRGPVNTALLDGYRHEFGSLPFAEKAGRLRKLPDKLQDLALHLIAAHHGFARPVISIEGCEDAPPSALEERAREIAMRFARLQKRWGPWGLAWWEALLRAADQQASRDNDAADSIAAKESV
jgi:CRISPR-associated endonuclease/helicase Cas3